jgi:hypothetical protein
MASKTFTLNNPGTIPVTIQSINFRDPPDINHVADLSNLGGSSSVTDNATLSYVLGVGASQTFTIDYNSTTAAVGTYEGRVLITGSDRASTVITSTIVVEATTTTTTTAAPMPSTIADFGLWLYDVDNADNSSYGNIILKLNVKPDGQWAVSSSTQYGPPQYHSWNIYSIPSTGDTKPDASNLVSNGSGALSKSGLWFNSITPGIGNNYWVRFSGHAFVSGVDFFGYNAASPTNITNRSGPSANVPFNSGWLSLSAERTVQIQDGGATIGSGSTVFGAAYGLFNPSLATWTGSATMEIATDSGGTNIVQTTKFGIYLRYRATYSTGTPP